MNQNIKLAKELIRIAKNLVADQQNGNDYLFPNMHDVKVLNCDMQRCFEKTCFDMDYECITSNRSIVDIYLFGNAQNKKPKDIFELGNENDEDYNHYEAESWESFFEDYHSSWLNNVTMREGLKLKAPYKYYISTGDSQSDKVQIIYDSSYVSNPQQFDKFLWGFSLYLEAEIDGETYYSYDLDYDKDYYDKNLVIKSIKNKLGNKFDDDIKRQLEQQLPDDNDINYDAFS